MKVLYFHQHFSTPQGSTGIRSYQMAQELIRQGHQVTMVCGSYGGGKTGLEFPFETGRRRGEVDGIEVIEFDLTYSNNDGLAKRAGTFLKFALKSIKLALTEKYDIIFATTTPLTAGLPGIFAKWFRRKPFVFEVRDLWPELPKQMGVIKNPVILGLMSILEWTSYRSANRCIGLSPGIVDGIASRGVDRSRITMVPNGCDLDLINNNAIAWRPEEIADRDFLAIFTGTHGMANGLDAVIDAAILLKQRKRSDIKILLVGQGKLKEGLQRRVMQENFDNIIFHNPVNKEKLSGLMAGADLGLQVLANVPAFYYGTSPNKFFDYISAGLPVLNNYPGWLADLIVENKCGIAVSPDDPTAFADALETAASDRSQLELMGVNARSLAENSFNRRDLALKWVDWVIGAAE